MNVRTSLLAIACMTALAAVPSGMAAQHPGDPAVDRARLAELLGQPGATQDSSHRVGATGISRVGPRAIVAWNSGLPWSMNDGPLWAGRGMSLSLTGGVTWRTAPAPLRVTATVAPTVAWSENREFFAFRYPGTDRSSFASPWHLGRASADLPLRFGAASFTTIDPGESSLTLEAGRVALGASTAAEWWGPAIRNTLVLSDNAPGIPRLFLRTARPLATPLGRLDAQLIAGTLTESRFFDTLATNDYRSVSGVRLSLRLPFDTGLTVGAARVVYGPASSAGAFAGRALDALTWWKPLAALGDSLPDGSSPQERDQLTSLFARWVFPAAGTEVYGEWARMELPRSMHELLESPQHTRGYTLGAQWAGRVRARDLLRVQAELTELSQSQVYADRPPPDYYTGRATLHGWTQRGQPLGAAIGPGGQSQWLASDFLTEAWQGGAFLGRIRWENDALYRQVNPRMTRHDVSVFGGVRGAMRGPLGDYGATLRIERRFNYLFQNEAFNAGEEGGNPVDVTNVSLRFTLTPR